MRKLLEFGRKAMFYVRVLTGIEERRIRSYRLQIEQRLRLAQERKEAVRKIPEQMILSEVRRMVEEMQNLNKSLQNMEADINEYFKPIDKEVESVINMQMEKEKAMTEMMGTMYKQAMLEKAEREATAEVTDPNKARTEMTTAMFKQALLEKAERDATAEVTDPNKERAEMMSAMFKQALLEKAEKEAVAEIKNTQNEMKASSSS